MINPAFAVDLKKKRELSEQNETQSLVMAQRQFLSSSPEKEKRRVRKDTAISGLDGGEK